MYLLTKDEAILLVRKNLDEQRVNDSDMLDVDDLDSNEFEEVLEKNLPEAINSVHTAAPVTILEGEMLDADEISGASISADVLSFGTKQEMLRLIAFKASDSPYVVCDPVPEYSAEGRMQLNPYTRGTSDRPRLVLLQGKVEDYLSSFKYYSLDRSYPSAAQAIERFEYIPRYRYKKDGSGSYRVSENVIENIIDQLTGMMLVTYNNTDKATYFFTKAGFGQPATE